MSPVKKSYRKISINNRLNEENRTLEIKETIGSPGLPAEIFENGIPKKRSRTVRKPTKLRNNRQSENIDALNLCDEESQG